jgi:1,2-diacylglycerol 3-beta-galactosyltransferase
MSSTAQVVILMSDTGGGHRASAEAICEGLQQVYGEQVHARLIDVFKDYTPYPFRKFPDWYPSVIKHGKDTTWGPTYHMTNGPKRARAMSRMSWPIMRKGMLRLAEELRSVDLIVCVHPLLQDGSLRALGSRRPPYVTVVTDLVSTHAFWYRPEVDRILTPTEAARNHAIRCGVLPEQVKVTGLPISLRFGRVSTSQTELRQQLGWQTQPLTILIVGGGDGMGPLEKITHSLAESGLPIQLAVVCGRNKELYQKLKAQTWQLPVHPYGFVTHMPDLMTAADIVVTKAGPSSVMEALGAGRPLILSSAIPGQEYGNVRYVVENQAGFWAPTSKDVLKAVTLVNNMSDTERESLLKNAQRISRPNSAIEIAHELAEFLPIATT